MANYNPHSPQILGEEWVPIRDEDVAFSPSVNAVELGHSFDLDTSRQVRDARFYAHELPAPAVAYQTALFGIYPYGLEDQSGPISQVMIPVSNGGVTGTGLQIAGASTVAEALLLSGDGKYILADGSNVSPTNLVMFFNTGQYSQLLQGKRILNVSLLYVGWARDINGSNATVPFVDPDPLTPATVFRLTNDAATQTITYSRFFGANTGNLWDLNTSIPPSSGDPAYGAREAVLNLGDVNLWWSTAVAPSATTDVMPYRYADLLRFDASSANRINSRVIFQVPNINSSNTQIFIDYFAMRVIYCEEQRVVYGGRRNGFGNLNYGANPVTLRNPAHTADPILPAGRYVQTLSWVNPGDIDFGGGTVSEFPELNGLRRLYEIPSFNGVQLNIPFPPEERLGDVFTSKVTAVLPQLSLHASGGALTEPHVYGRQVAAQVYGANTATQDIYDDISGVNAVYPQVRYYARRFGDTTIPLTLTGVGAFSGSSASVSVADFDALSEIIDGWKEVTLRFGTPPTMGAAAGSPAWTWSATSETAGNRWEVMGASAPAVSGVPGSLLHLAAQQLSGATYQPPAGATNELTWMPQGIGSPYVSGATADVTSDAVLIFSQDPPTVTGVSLTAQTQTVTGIGFDCGSLPCCIPSGIAYQQIQWGATSLTSPAPDILDTFSRVAANGFGTADSGQTWVNTLVSAGTDAQISVNGATGLHTPQGIPLAIVNTIGANVSDSDAYMTYSTTATTASAEVSILARFTDTSNYYRVVHNIATNALVIQKVVAGVTTALASGTGAGTTTAALRVRFRVVGTTLLAKSWLASDVEPAAWTLSATDTALTSGVAGLLTYQDTASKTFSFDNFQVTNLSVGSFGAYELQRWDSVTGGDFETIMLATDPALVSFNDFEARVGITSVYRIRSLNALNFAGSWSTYVSGAPPTPGVIGGCPDMTGALIFTSNSAQSGYLNAAYVMQWEGAPSEDFALPEAEMVQFQPIYGRDGSVAFHGTERGLEAFSRTVLLQAAAIAPERLADAKTIRDLAWADLPYVCVRDDIGDRWFANVRVPTVAVRHNRTKYMARIDIVETSVCPYPVNP